MLTRALQGVLEVPLPREIAALNVDLTEIEPVERRVGTLLWTETDHGGGASGPFPATGPARTRSGPSARPRVTYPRTTFSRGAWS